MSQHFKYSCHTGNAPAVNAIALRVVWVVALLVLDSGIGLNNAVASTTVPAASYWDTFRADLEMVDNGVPVLSKAYGMSFRGNEECCSDQGSISVCWWQDAERDQVVCTESWQDNCTGSNSCITNIPLEGFNPPNDWGLCGCDTDEDCNLGVCTDDGICGPSFCNGYMACSCWGGCAEADPYGYENFQQMCADVNSGLPGFCCESNYPNNRSGTAIGYCSADPLCNFACADNQDCDDNNPCTTDQCVNEGCVNANLPSGTDCSGVLALPDGLSEDCTTWTCQLGTCTLDVTNEGVEGCTDNQAATDPSWHDDCYFHQCASGECAASLEAVGELCDDGNDCSDSTCDDSGNCDSAPLAGPTGACCDPAVLSTYDDANECTDDLCDATYHDQNTAVAAGSPCPNDQPEVDDACGTWACGDGASTGVCIETRHTGDPCDDSVDNSTGGANHDCGEWTCNADGSCTEKNAALIGASCAGTESDDTCGRWLCDASGSCVETIYTNAACDTAAGGPGGDNTECTRWYCDATGDCIENNWGDGSSCTGDHLDDWCGIWLCDSGSCEESVFENRACDDSVSSLGGANSFCNTWYCNAAGDCINDIQNGRACDSASGGPGEDNDFCGTWSCDTDGDCALDAEPDGTPCEWAADGDECGLRECQGGTCADYNLSVGTECTPTGPEDDCRTYECDADHVCSEADDLFGTGMDTSLENCSGGALGTLTTGAPSISEAGDNACADDDLDVLSTDRFSACNYTDYADAVYSFRETTDTDFQLRHTVVSVAAGDSGGYSDIHEWDPLIYTRSDCSDGSTQYTCNDDCDFTQTNMPADECAVGLALGADDSAVTTGPWPLRDYPDSNETGGMTTIDTYETTVAVDSRLCTSDSSCPEGGEFNLNLVLEDHDNDDCRNTASYVAAPKIEGGSYWKERWRGNTTGYANFFEANSVSSPSCWDGTLGNVGTGDPKAAFFRIDLPEGQADLGDGILWNHTYKIYTDHGGIDEMSTVLGFWGTGNLADGATQCRSAIGTEDLCLGGGEYYPRERIIRFDDTDRWDQGWVSVSNRNVGESGNYEINIIRAPRPFVSMAKIYAGSPDMGGCACTPPPPNTSNVMDLEGYRLDFLPTNDIVEGYAVLASKPSSGLDNGWLVDPQSATGKIEHQQICSGVGCATNLNSIPQRDLGFALPIGGDFFSNYCINAGGYVSLRRLPTDGCNTYDTSPTMEKITVDYEDVGGWSGNNGYGPLAAPLWGGIIPCYGANKTCISSGWSGCQLYAWDESTCNSSRNGEIFSDLVSFEGTMARVISWDGFQSQLEPKSGLSRDNSLQFQVILRIDGRITYFYKSPSSVTAWDDILEYAGWTIGLSGTRNQYCDSDADCSVLGTGLECDLDDYYIEGEDDPVYEATHYCIKRINDYLDPAEVGGSWQGGP